MHKRTDSWRLPADSLPKLGFPIRDVHKLHMESFPITYVSNTSVCWKLGLKHWSCFHCCLCLMKSPFLLWTPYKASSFSYHLIHTMEQYFQMCHMPPPRHEEVYEALCSFFMLQVQDCWFFLWRDVLDSVNTKGERVISKPLVLTYNIFCCPVQVNVNCFLSFFQIRREKQMKHIQQMNGCIPCIHFYVNLL